MYSVLNTCTKEYLNIETMLQVFDTYVSSILNYGCEIWGFNMAKDVEKVHMDFCKRILKVKKCTPNYMLYSELGRYPMALTRKLRMIKYWVKLLNTSNVILKSLYEDMLDRLGSGNWLSQIKDLLMSLGLGYVWYNQYVPNCNIFLTQVKSVLNDQFLQEMYEYFESSSKCIVYRNLHDVHCLQYYIRKSLPENLICTLSKFRLSSHDLNIEKGRYQNIPRENRICGKCNRNEIEDEYHFTLICPYYRDLRNTYIHRYYYIRPSMYKFIQLLNVKNKKKLCNLSKFLNGAFAKRKS